MKLLNIDSLISNLDLDKISDEQKNKSFPELQELIYFVEILNLELESYNSTNDQREFQEILNSIDTCYNKCKHIYSYIKHNSKDTDEKEWEKELKYYFYKYITENIKQFKPLFNVERNVNDIKIYNYMKETNNKMKVVLFDLDYIKRSITNTSTSNSGMRIIDHSHLEELHNQFETIYQYDSEICDEDDEAEAETSSIGSNNIMQYTFL